MIFKFCVWPSEMKESKEDNAKILKEGCRTKDRPVTGRALSGAAICCCPCIFRSRKTVDVESAGTPVIAFTLNQSPDATHVPTQ